MDQKTLVEQLQGRSEFIENYLGGSRTIGALRDEFGDKYLLNFGDDFDDFSYRVIIKERGYTGAVLPMVGGADPVQLEWEGDDDFYQPIRGSKCTINLMVTDSVTYDNFYEQPEKTYKVLLQWYGYDGTGTGPSTWNTFWSGWLVTDSFKELVSTKPYPIKLEAHDGLGSIDDFNINPAAYQPQFGTESLYPYQIKIIADILSNIDLKLDILAVHEWLVYRSREGVLPANTAAFDSFIFNGEQKSTKEILEAILLSTNSRIFQADNRWCIIPNSCYEPSTFTANISSYTQYLGYQPTDILAQKTTHLQTQNSEIVSFEHFNPAGAYLGQLSIDAHIAMPADVQNIGNDLVVEYLPPYKEVSIDYNIEPFNHRKYQANENQFFNYGNTGYTIAVNSGIQEGYIGQYEYTLGNSLYSYRALQAVTNPSFYIPLITSKLPQFSLENYNVRANAKLRLNIGYLYDSTRTAIDIEFRYSIKWTSPFGGSDRWYNPATENWDFSVVYIDQTSTRQHLNNIWESTDLEFNLLGNANTLEVTIYRPYMATTGNYNGLYIGEVSLQAEDLLDQKPHNYKITQGNNTDVYEQERASVEHITGVQVFPNFIVANGQYAQRPRDNYATWVPTNRSQVINREIMNDFRKGVHRYEGTIKNNHYKPISLLNRLWINFGTSVMQLPDSCYIDSMKVSLKRNAYKVNMHLPNIDSDQLAVETNQFKK